VTYRVVILPSARRDMRRLDRDVLRRMTTAIRALEEDPRPSGCKKIQGQADTWRIRVGNYRVVYEIVDEQLLVSVVHARHRRDVYR
jgi:mRNA interferase RelE/StbE